MMKVIQKEYLLVALLLLYLSSSVASEISPFTVNFSEEEIANVITKVKSARLHPSSFGDWNYGVNKEYFEEFLSYWTTKYNWTQQQEYLNKFPQFQTNIQNLTLHFLHVLS